MSVRRRHGLRFLILIPAALASPAGVGDLVSGSYDPLQRGTVAAVDADPPNPGADTTLGYDAEAPEATAFARVVETNPDAAVAQLEQDFRRTGRLGPALHWAPQLEERRPANQTLLALHTVALAAAGDLDQATARRARAVPDTDAARLYLSLAGALVSSRLGDTGEALRRARDAARIDADHPYLLTLIGSLHLRRGESQQAVSSLERAVTTAPELIAAVLFLASDRLHAGDSIGALAAYQAVLAAQPDHCTALVGAATVERAAGNAGSARQRLETCLSKEPANRTALQLAATVALDQGRFDDAQELAKAMLAGAPDTANLLLADIALRRDQPAQARELLAKVSPDPQADYLRAYADLIAGDIGAARERSSALQEQVPDSAGARFMNIVLRIRQGQRASEAELSALRALPAGEPLADFVAASARAAGGQIPAALAQWRTATPIIAGFSVAGLPEEAIDAERFAAARPFLLTGVLLQLKSLHPAAERAYSEALEENPDSAVVLLLSALGALSAGDREVALQRLSQATAAAPGLTAAHMMLGDLKLQAGDLDAAAAEYEKALVTTTNAGALLKLGLVQERLGKDAEAEQTYQRFIDSYPDAFVGYNQLAWLLARRGVELDRALALAETANELQPGNSAINDTLGWIHFQLGHHAQALEYAKEANRIAQGSNPEILFHLARIHEAMGERSRAKAALEQSLASEQSFGAREDAQALLDALR